VKLLTDWRSNSESGTNESCAFCEGNLLLDKEVMRNWAATHNFCFVGRCRRERENKLLQFQSHRRVFLRDPCSIYESCKGGSEGWWNGWGEKSGMFDRREDVEVGECTDDEEEDYSLDGRVG
jgi:hypothetical protein